ncbi:MAG: hypothetical protein AAGN35_21315 [Bacteroidota bacterium]
MKKRTAKESQDLSPRNSQASSAQSFPAAQTSYPTAPAADQEAPLQLMLSAYAGPDVLVQGYNFSQTDVGSYFQTPSPKGLTIGLLISYRVGSRPIFQTFRPVQTLTGTTYQKHGTIAPSLRSAFVLLQRSAVPAGILALEGNEAKEDSDDDDDSGGDEELFLMEEEADVALEEKEDPTELLGEANMAEVKSDGGTGADGQWVDGGGLFPGLEVKKTGGKVTRYRKKGKVKEYNWNNNALKTRFRLGGARGPGNAEIIETHKATSFKYVQPNEEEVPAKSVGYIGNVPAPQYATDNTADKPASKLHEMYMGAFPEAQAPYRMRTVFGLNIIDDVRDLAKSTDDTRKALLATLVQEQGKINTQDGYGAVIGYLLAYPIQDKMHQNGRVPADYVRKVIALTSGANLGKANFPFAGVRYGMMYSSIAKRFETDLKKYNYDVFYHTGDADLISLHPQGDEENSVFEEYSAYIEGQRSGTDTSDIARLGGSYQFADADISAALTTKYGVAVQDIMNRTVAITKLLNEFDMKFRSIMNVGTPAGWFAEPNTLLNSSIVELDAIETAMTQRAAKSKGMPDYALPVHKELRDLDAKEAPTESHFLNDSKYRLQTSARHDLPAGYVSSADTGAGLLEAGRQFHNAQFRSSQVSAIWSASYKSLTKTNAGSIYGYLVQNASSLTLAHLRKDNLVGLTDTVAVGVGHGAWQWISKGNNILAFREMTDKMQKVLVAYHATAAKITQQIPDA